MSPSRAFGPSIGWAGFRLVSRVSCVFRFLCTLYEIESWRVCFLEHLVLKSDAFQFLISRAFDPKYHIRSSRSQSIFLGHFNSIIKSCPKISIQLSPAFLSKYYINSQTPNPFKFRPSHFLECNILNIHIYNFSYYSIPK